MSNPNSPRRTKIIATLGPATEDPETLTQLIAAGTDLIRLNFSHGSALDHIRRVTTIRQCSAKLGKEVGIIADLQGPKIRIGRFQTGKIELRAGDPFILDAALDLALGTQERVGIDYKALPRDVHPKDLLLLDDGLIEIEVKRVRGGCIECDVLSGGILSGQKGINRKGGGLSAGSFTDKDRHDLKLAVEAQVDYLAVSFPRDARDLEEARKYVRACGAQTGIIAKIERCEALDNIDEIIQASDAVMVARGDLGVEIGPADVPGAQKMIIHRARTLDRAVITATQMMESMIHALIPTRAEVSDVANAVLDGTDAVMLSAETATGQYPVKTVETMANICVSAEKNPLTHVSKHRLECFFHRIDETIAMATMYTANHLPIKAIITLTESGATPLWMSRIRSGIPIYALTRHLPTQRKMTLYRGVYPLAFDPTEIARPKLNEAAVRVVQQLNLIAPGDYIILTKGNAMGELGGTNAMKIIKVGEIC